MSDVKGFSGIGGRDLESGRFPTAQIFGLRLRLGPLVKDAHVGVAAAGGSAGHVEHLAQAGPPAADIASAAGCAVAAGERSCAGQGRGLLRADAAELGHVGAKHSRGNRTDPRYGAQDLCAASQGFVGFEGIGNGLVEHTDLALGSVVEAAECGRCGPGPAWRHRCDRSWLVGPCCAQTAGPAAGWPGRPRGQPRRGGGAGRDGSVLSVPAPRGAHLACATSPVPRKTLRRWMLAVGLWSRRRKRKPHRSRRQRKAHFGELIQLDGSHHDWLEGRGPKGCMMNFVDDATGRALRRFSDEETTWAAADLLQAWVRQYGIPKALYCDWKNVYKRQPTSREALAGIEPATQFGRICAKLGIGIIAASSPQAKGRVERHHGTHQDRLIKTMRLEGIADYEAANRYVDEKYLDEHNAKFVFEPSAGADFHRRLPKRLELK